MIIDTLSSFRDGSPHRDVIAQSWRRSALSGVSPDSALPTLADDVCSDTPLLAAARPVLDDAANQLTDTGTSLILVDHECRMVSRQTLGSAVERALDGAGATHGVDLGEPAVGTTALGTPAETRRGLAVNGEEHYLESFKSLSCFGQPIVHPATRRLVGILCLTEIAPHISPLAIPLVNGVVAGITDRLLDGSRAQQRIILNAFQRVAVRRDVAVAAISEDLQLTNALAADLLAPADIAALRAVASDPAVHETSIPLTLTSGVGADVHVTPIPGARGAAIFWLRHRSGPSSHPTGAQPSRSRAAAATVAVSGEPGTGRTTHALSIAGEGASVVDVAEELINGYTVDVVTLISDARAARRPLIIDGVDLVDDRSITLLGTAVQSATTDAPIVVVSGSLAQARPAVAALVARCGTHTELPTLRTRTTELPSIAGDIVTRIAGHDAPTLSTAATDALLSQEWAGNLVELFAVLRQAVASCRGRAARVIEFADLPSSYRTTSRAAHLAGREQAERAAIVDALERNAHNKVHAARDLGISRTTLYARIRALGI